MNARFKKKCNHGGGDLSNEFRILHYCVCMYIEVDEIDLFSFSSYCGIIGMIDSFVF